VELRVPAAFGATNQAPEIHFLTRRLDAVRCALRYVASIVTVFGSALAAARPDIMRRNIPIGYRRLHILLLRGGHHDQPQEDIAALP
jgi:hypothetical protein